MKFLADENIDARLVTYLVSRGIDITYGPKGLRNSLLLHLALREGRMLITKDTDFLNPVLYPLKDSPGILLLRIHPPDLEKTKAAFLEFLKKISKKRVGHKTFLLREDSLDVFF